MAFQAASIVSPVITGPTLTESVQPQPPLFGVVTDISSLPTSVGVLWNNGRLETAVPIAALDEILDADASVVTEFRGKLVGITSVEASPEYQGVVIALFKRDTASGGTPGPNRALVYSASNGFYYESNATSLGAVAGR